MEIHVLPRWTTHGLNVRESQGQCRGNSQAPSTGDLEDSMTCHLGSSQTPTCSPPPSMAWVHWLPVPITSCFTSSLVLLHPGVQSPELGTQQPASFPLAVSPDFLGISFKGLKLTCQAEKESRKSPGRMIQMMTEGGGTAVRRGQVVRNQDGLLVPGKARPEQARKKGLWTLQAERRAHTWRWERIA